MTNNDEEGTSGTAFFILLKLRKIESAFSPSGIDLKKLCSTLPCPQGPNLLTPSTLELIRGRRFLVLCLFLFLDFFRLLVLFVLFDPLPVDDQLLRPRLRLLLLNLRTRREEERPRSVC